MEDSENKENILDYIGQENSKTSLQQKFNKFRKERHEKFKFQQYLKTAHKFDRNTAEFKAFLRSKFIETAKKYIGVPYAQKYHKLGDKHYDSPIFLDCCGLIRQVVYDLREEFGFTLARWNQGYQFDTLPNTLEFEKMQPGDLIFYSATYYNKNKIVHAHDMVHVEIYMGGETSLGARWHSGIVSIFPSYKFESTTYHSINIHYKSIDTWISGICRSFCEKHPWRDDRDVWAHDKFSVFADEDEVEIPQKELIPESELKELEIVKVIQPKLVFIGKGNNDKLIRSYFSNDKFIIMNQKEAYSANFYFKWVQTVSEINFFTFKEGEQIVCHIPNISILTTKTGLLQTIKDYEATSNSLDPTPFSANFLPPSFRLDVLSDEIQFINFPDENYWIYKPYGNNQGKGIQLFRNIKFFKQQFIKSKKFYLSEYSMNKFLCESDKKNIMNSEIFPENEKESNEEDIEDFTINPNSIMQKYLEKPLLIEKKKFDIRCYALIATTKPFFVLFHHGYIRLSIEDYDLSVFEDNQAKLIHLTNNSVQKKHPNYSTKKEDSIWTMKSFEDYLLKKENKNETEINDIYKRIKDIISYVIKAGSEKITKKIGFYELIGCDFMIDENYNPYLLEMNTNPALFTDLKAHKEVLPDLLFKTLDLVLKINEKPSEISKTLESYEEGLNLNGFEVLINEIVKQK